MICKAPKSQKESERKVNLGMQQSTLISLYHD